MTKWFAARRLRRQVSADWERQSAVIEAAKDDRRARLAGQESDVAHLEAMLFRYDPVGINFENNTDEYRAEAETITLRRHEAHSAEELRRVIHEEFVWWFDAETAGPEARYAPIAEELWGDWRPDTRHQ